MVCEQPAVDGQSVATVTNKVPYVLQLEPSPLGLPMMHSSSSPAFSLVPRLRGPSLEPRLSVSGFEASMAQHCLSPIEAKCTRTFNFWEMFMRI